MLAFFVQMFKWGFWNDLCDKKLLSHRKVENKTQRRKCRFRRFTIASVLDFYMINGIRAKVIFIIMNGNRFDVSIRQFSSVKLFEQRMRIKIRNDFK